MRELTPEKKIARAIKTSKGQISGVRLVAEVGLDDPEDVFQPYWFYDFMTLIEGVKNVFA